MPKKLGRLPFVALVLLLVAAVAAPAALQQIQPLAIDRGATGLGLALRRVGTSGRVLYVTTSTTACSSASRAASGCTPPCSR
jgi:hypothetical protein